MRPKTVDVPDELGPVFEAAERVVFELFRDKREVPSRGTIEIAGQRYLLIRAASLSVRFFELVRDLYGEGRWTEADEFSRDISFDLAHGIGKSDAECYARRTGVEEPLAKPAAGPVYFAHAGWARVELEQAIREYLDAHNADPKPFVWHKTADQIFASVTRHCQRVLDLFAEG